MTAARFAFIFLPICYFCLKGAIENIHAGTCKTIWEAHSGEQCVV